ncbi:uncharacterized protein LOC125013943 isoform X2 [Mugil cephalus]|uniref:uncharacterized protein LOC125013943 isoform X2 n=1 Tax=Mugil cephalus TaxID=48193 RepID=UPI001FB6F217|nr:uncharacterized protein LOC125013943 isoform X2 [Mugil cephalus]
MRQQICHGRGVPLSCLLFSGCVNVLQRAEGNGHVGKCKMLQFAVYFPSKTGCPLVKTEITPGNHGTNMCLLLRSMTRCAHITALVYQWRTKRCACTCKMPSMFYSTSAGCVGVVQPADSDRWVGRFCLAAVLLLSVYTRLTRRDSDSSTGMLFTLTLRSFSPSVTVYRQSERSIIAVCLSCALRRTVHVLIACRAAHTVMKRFRPRQQHFRILPVTVLFLWLTFCSPLGLESVKNVSRDGLVEYVESTQRACVLAQTEVLAALCSMLVLLTTLLQSVLTKLNVLSVLFHVQLVTCLQDSVVPRKYILIVKISRFI